MTRKHRGLRAYLALAAAPVMLLATVVLPAAGAQAMVTGRPAPAATRSPGGIPPGHTALPGQANRSKPAKAPAKDVRPLCSAPKRGFAACTTLVRTDVKARKGTLPADGAPSGYGPSDLQSAYNLPSSTAGSGQTVAVVTAGDDPTLEPDLGTYRAQYGLPACTTANGCFAKVNQDGQQGPYPPDIPGWPGTMVLEIDMVSAICPNCHILVVEANDDSIANLHAAGDEAVALGAKYVVDGWAGCEYSGETSDDQYFNHPGVVITAPDGDWGYDGYTDFGNGSCSGPAYPASSQYVTSVGGTTLTQDSSVPRGWTETVWNGPSQGDSGATGSGCSQYEPKPSWQTDPGCANRMTNDVSADADPNTGVASYNSRVGGWIELGGTTMAAAIIASVYALAGTPLAGSYPASYPYADPSTLNDVTTGTNYNQSCTPAYACTAGPGYDGPTGLGTPDGVAAFAAAVGTVTGTVTDTATGQPLSGATVSIGNYSATTNSSGQYTIGVPPGSYRMTVSAYGYADKAKTGVQVTKSQTTTENFRLATAAPVTVSGTVTDGSGHKWPIYAKISIPGDPAGPFYTNPYTGAYSVTVPGQTTHTLQVTPVNLPGYAAKNQPVHLGTSDTVSNIKLSIDRDSCTAPGYGWKYSGGGTEFTGWTGATPQNGWTVTADQGGNGDTWVFGNNPTGEGTPPDSDGQFAIADSLHDSSGTLDTSLVSPVINLSGVSSPQIGFDTSYQVRNTSTSAEADLSLDGGQTWSTVWQQTGTAVDTPVSIPIPQAAGQSDVQVRFHYAAGANLWWSLDNVFIGAETCTGFTRGGLIAGQVSDGNTGTPLDGATVASGTNAGEAMTTADSAGAGDGFYETFAAGTGGHSFTGTDRWYAPDTETVPVTANTVTRQDFALAAGRVTVSTRSLSATVTLGKAVTRTVTFTNQGTASARVSLSGQDNGFTPVSGQAAARAAGTPVRRITVHATYVPARSGLRHKLSRQTAQAGAQWTSIPNYPNPVSGNSVAADPSTGDIYSIGGYNGGQVAGGQLTTASYVYDAAAGTWSPIANPPRALDHPAAAFADGSLYLIGGWYLPQISPASSEVYAYDPVSNTWSQVASLPVGVWRASVAVLDGQIYVIGGCHIAVIDDQCTSLVQRYDPVSNTWSTQVASYPPAIQHDSTSVATPTACAGLSGKLVCAGGDEWTENIGDGQISATWIYDPGSNTWTQGGDMPQPVDAAASAGANSELQAIGGAGINSGALSQVNQYDPATSTSSALPSLSQPESDGGAACAASGLYMVGGIGVSGNNRVGLSSAEVLPGHTCRAMPWMSEDHSSVVVPPGQSVTVTLTLDSSGLAQPGTYAGDLEVAADTPYPVQSSVPVTLQANPPASWGELTGTVTDGTTGQPIAGARVQICTHYDRTTGACGTGSQTYPVTAGASGSYQWWLPAADNPLQVVVSAAGYQPQAAVVKVTRGAVTTLNFALKEGSG